MGIDAVLRQFGTFVKDHLKIMLPRQRIAGRFARRIYRRFRSYLGYTSDMERCNRDYPAWRRLQTINVEEIRRDIMDMHSPPLISVIMPVYNPPLKFLKMAVESVRQQYYPHWQLCIADDCSPDPAIASFLRDSAQADARIQVVFRKSRGNISAASNTALELAAGTYVAFLDHDDVLTHHALYRVAKVIRENPSVDWIYSDEDKLDETGDLKDPFFKPDWSPEFLMACMYPCHLGVYRTSLIREVGGLDSEFDFAQDHHLALRVAARNPCVHHISDVLYHWRMHSRSTASTPEAKPEAHAAAGNAIQAYLSLTGQRGRVESGSGVGTHRVRLDIIGCPRISILIPTKFSRRPDTQRPYLHQCVESIVKHSTYRNYEILAIHNCPPPNDIRDSLETLGTRLLPFGSLEKFNFSRSINHGAAQATGDYLLLLNDDTEVITPDWIESMLEFCQQEAIGAVGCRLLFPDRTVQHAGVVIMPSGPDHPYYQANEDQLDYFGTLHLHRNVSAVTAACLMTRSDVFRSVHGFTEDFPLNYNDVDYCLKVRQFGKRIVYTPYACLFHYEKVSRAKNVESWELPLFKSRWPEFANDPYYNRNLSQIRCYMGLNLETQRRETMEPAA